MKWEKTKENTNVIKMSEKQTRNAGNSLSSGANEAHFRVGVCERFFGGAVRGFLGGLVVCSFLSSCLL